MKASILDLRRRMKDVLRALDRNEPVTILHRGTEKAVLVPVGGEKHPTPAASSHPAFGLWKDRPAAQDVDHLVRTLRQGRFHAL